MYGLLVKCQVSEFGSQKNGFPYSKVLILAKILGQCAFTVIFLKFYEFNFIKVIVSEVASRMTDAVDQITLLRLDLLRAVLLGSMCSFLFRYLGQTW